jgi:predicted alpha/beta superfamily hydrolase
MRKTQIERFLWFTLLTAESAKTSSTLQASAPYHDPRYAKPSGTISGATKFRKFIAEQVIPSIEDQYRTNSQRIIIGESLAGLFIVETLLRQPQLFTDYIAVSPSLWYDDRYLAKNAGELLKSHQDAPRRLYLTMASEGGTMQLGLDEVLNAITQRKFDHLQVKYVDRSKREHHWTVYHDAALDALRWTLPAPEAKLDQ